MRCMRGFVIGIMLCASSSVGAQNVQTQLAESSATSSSIAPLRPGSRLETSEVGRDWLKYIVRCALPAGSDVAVTHEGASDVLQGAFGVAPEWAHAPLSPSGQRWVSACLLSFVNALGEHVLVSQRGEQDNLRATVTPGERDEFAYQEAAFYGDLFADDGASYVCRGNGGTGKAPSRAKRLCSDASEHAGISRCGMIIAGDCRDVCSGEDALDHAFSHCRGGYRVYDEVITVFLRVEKP